MRRLAVWRKRIPFGVAAVLVTIALFGLSLTIRWDAIVFPGWINPDEAELFASGRRAAMQMLPPMASFTATTHMILWPMSLGGLGLLGVPMDLRSAHVLSALAYASVLSMVWIFTARRVGWVASGMFVLPVAGWMPVSYTHLTLPTIYSV